MKNDQKIRREIKVIDSLLQDENYTIEMARELNTAYYKGIGETPPPFFTEVDDTAYVQKNLEEQKIAINIAGFYALECGLEYLSDQNNLTPAEWLEKIIRKQVDDSAILLLNRFANATWKAGQPFRGLERIKKPNFISASSLPTNEVQKRL